MNIARRIEKIVHRHGIDSCAVSLGARVIELLALDQRTTPQGLAASLRQQSELMCREVADSATALQIVDEIVVVLDLQTRLAWPRLSETRCPEPGNHSQFLGTRLRLEFCT